MVSSLTSSRICKALITYCGLTVNVHRIERVAAICEPAFPAFSLLAAVLLEFHTENDVHCENRWRP
jgi:hypothetical protein